MHFSFRQGDSGHAMENEAPQWVNLTPPRHGWFAGVDEPPAARQFLESTDIAHTMAIGGASVKGYQKVFQ